jgi:hypothetical protein
MQWFSVIISGTDERGLFDFEEVKVQAFSTVGAIEEATLLYEEGVVAQKLASVLEVRINPVQE